MKIRAERAPFADALAWVSQAVSPKPASPELSGIRLSAADGLLTIKGYDYDRAHTARLAVDVHSAGEALISSRFLKIVGVMKGKDVDLTLDDGRLTVSSVGSTYRASSMAVDRFPELPSLPPKVGSADAADLSAAVAAVRHPIDDGSAFEQLRGLHVEGNHGLELVGIERSQVAHATVAWENEGDLEATAHSGMVSDALKGMAGRVDIGATEGLLGFSDDSRAVTVRTYADKFIEWRNLLQVPADSPAVSLESEDLKDALKRVRSILDRETIAVGFADGALTIEGTTDGSGGQEVIEASTEGEALRGLDPRKLADALAAVPSGPLTIRVHPRGLWVIEPVDHEHLTFAVMSMKTLPGGTRS